MEITFQNKRDDFEAFYDYMVNTTAEGQRLGRQAYRQRQIWTIGFVALFGALAWGNTGSWKSGLAISIFFLVILELLLLLQLGLKPRASAGKEIYRSQERLLSAKDLKIFQLPRTLKAENEWLEISSSEALHRWRWRRVDKIGITPNFIFIHVGSCPVVYIPKRDFPSEQSFVEFGRKLLELKEKYKDQPIGAE